MLAGLISLRDASTPEPCAMIYSEGDPHPSACLACTRMTDPTGKWESGSSTPPGRINTLVRSGGSRENNLDLAYSGIPQGNWAHLSPECELALTRSPVAC
jgi:hypothetical protein